MNIGSHKAVFLLAVAALLAAIASTSRGAAAAADPQQETFQRSFTVSHGATLLVKNYKGAIHVAATDGNQVVIDVHKRFEGSDSDRKWWMENVKVDFRNDPNRVEVKVEYPTRTCVLCWGNHDYTTA